jgi:hypothetical protein
MTTPDLPVPSTTSPAPSPRDPRATVHVPSVPSQPGPPVGAPSAPVGTVRSTGTSILLFIVTFGIYGLVWYFKTHEEMKRHTGEGLGGGLALLIAFLVGIASPYLSSSEVGRLYTLRGQAAPVSGTTGLWYFPGIFLLGLGPIVWFVKTNGALNAYWRSVGAR